MCVWTIWKDVKLLTCTWFFAWGSNLSLVFYLNSTKVSNLNFSRGMECASDVSIQRRRICCTVIWIGDAQSTYLLNLSHFRQWRPAKPRTGMSFPVASGPSSELLYQQVQYTVRFSQSKLLPISSDGTVAFCKDKERFLLLRFSWPVIRFLLSDF